VKVMQSCTGFAGILDEALYDTCFWTSTQAIGVQIIPTQTFVCSTPHQNVASLVQMSKRPSQPVLGGLTLTQYLCISS